MGHSHEVKCEDLQSLERKCVPGTGYEGISQVSDPVHGQGDDEDVDDSNFVDDRVGVEQERDGDQGAGGDGQSKQVDWSIQILLQRETVKYMKRGRSLQP